ncbi:MAG TPA: hypothetical protein DDW31_05685 [candidate division Zixibacteria bacterium]|jgi:hypothetical protein|nr:hypothetical protein [candidate division Zixibacteria bacterium]
MRTTAILAALMAAASAAAAQTGQPLFHIERTMNANKLYYEANVGTDGKIDPKDPVRAYWIMWAKDPSGKTTEGLNLIERTKVYGFNVLPDKSGKHHNMALKPFKERLIKVYLAEGKARAEMIIDGRPSYFSRMHIFSKGNSKPDSIKLHGTDVELGTKTYELFIPKKD